jgi:hypothetical protein
MLDRSGEGNLEMEDREAELLRVISLWMPQATQERYAELRRRRGAEILTPAEHAELLLLIELSEQQNVVRVKALAELAQLRGVTIEELIDQLGIRPPPYE